MRLLQYDDRLIDRFSCGLEFRKAAKHECHECKSIRMSQVGAVKCFIAVLLSIQACGNAQEIFRIDVVDKENGWPVPLVELRTTHDVRFVTDNAGVVALDLPELMGQETWLFVQGHGYSVAEDRFGYRGIRVVPRPGKSIRVEVERELPAKRLGRITGGGLFAESQQFGEMLTWKEQGILGCDSVLSVEHNGKKFWAWGDTVLPNYPLGRFHMIAATSKVQPFDNLAPPVKLPFNYFVNARGIPRNVAEMPGVGPTWLRGLASLPDKTGTLHLVATYSKIKPPLEEYERGLCVWNEAEEKFEKFKMLWTKTPAQPKPVPAPQGHATNVVDNQAGTRSVVFGDPFPSLRCAATFEAWADPKQWVHLDAHPEVSVQGTGNKIVPHRGSIAWNNYRKRWISIFTQLGGTSSHIGELWYAEAEQPEGPWNDAVQVVTHNNYSFYNPKIHVLDQLGDSPVVLFEATYTKAFSKTSTPSPTGACAVSARIWEFNPCQR